MDHVIEAIKQSIRHLGGQVQTAEKLGTHQSTVSEWVTGKAAVPPAKCVRIEGLTKRKFRREQLRHDSHEIWPERTRRRRNQRDEKE